MSLRDRLNSVSMEEVTPAGSNTLVPTKESTTPAVETTSTPVNTNIEVVESKPIDSEPTTPTKTEGTAQYDVSDLHSIKERWAADHPDLTPVLDEALKEMERDLQKKYQSVASLKKEAAEKIIYDDKIKNIPQPELLGMVDLYNVINYGTPQQKEAAAERLFELQDQLREQATNQNSNVGTQNIDLSSVPEFRQMQEYLKAQQLQNLTSQAESAFKNLETEFGNQPIPQTQKDHVYDRLRELNLSIEHIPLVWRSEYGLAYARQSNLRKQQETAKAKEGLSVTTSNIPGNSEPAEKPKNLRSRLLEDCDLYGLS